MAIDGVDEQRLLELQNKLLSPSDPIRSAEFLRGPEGVLKDIRRHLSTKGRHVFIYGDQGLGKTSLAHTAAIEFHPSDSDPIRVAGAVGETFETIISSVVRCVHLKMKDLEKLKSRGRLGCR